MNGRKTKNVSFNEDKFEAIHYGTNTSGNNVLIPRHLIAQLPELLPDDDGRFVSHTAHQKDSLQG